MSEPGDHDDGGNGEISMAIKRQTKHTSPVPDVSHKELVDHAFFWLGKEYSVRFRERVTTCCEIPDAIGFKGSHSTLIECKASRADFKADENKFFRKAPDYGMGTERYYMCPAGLIDVEELPAGWGLIYVYDKPPDKRSRRKTKVVKTSETFQKSWPEEVKYLVSAIRRIDISMAVFIGDNEP